MSWNKVNTTSEEKQPRHIMLWCYSFKVHPMIPMISSLQSLVAVNSWNNSFQNDFSADVFSPWHDTNAHLTAPDQHSAKPSVFKNTIKNTRNKI